MNTINAIANFALRVATVAFIAAMTFLGLLVLNLFSVPLGTNPVVTVLGVACMASWRLYRGSTPRKEIERFLDLHGPSASVEPRSNNRCRGP